MYTNSLTNLILGNSKAPAPRGAYVVKGEPLGTGGRLALGQRNEYHGFSF